MFFISFLLVFLSSYFITCIFAPKSGKTKAAGFLILLVSVFAQVVLTFEILSLFQAISMYNVLLINFLFCLITGFLWIKKDKPFYIPDLKNTFKRITAALKRDKVLMIISFGFVFFILTAILLNLFMPVISFDSLTYHLNRAAFWMSQGSLNHFDIPDNRNLVMPINSEILYLWVLVFVKNDIGLGFFSFFGYIASIFSVYTILDITGFSERRKLWTVFMLSSLASVIAEASGMETDILIAGLVLSSITLFLTALKEEKKLPLIFFSSLAYALAMGTKSPSVITFPGVFLLLVFLTLQNNKKDFYKPLAAFLIMIFANFIIFSSYNYILNFIDYGNFLGSEAAVALHSFRGGVKAVIANFIRYIFMLFDFSGFRYSDYVGVHITNLKLAIFNILNIPPELGVAMTDNNIINNRLLDVKMGVGLLGFLLFLPGIIVSFIVAVTEKIRKGKVSLKNSIIAAFGLMFLINIFCMSFSIAYMVFSVRFVTFMVVISAPVFAVSYMKKTNIIKLLILFFVMSYFLVMSVNLSSRSYGQILKVILQQRTLDDAREKIRCALFVGYKGKMPFCHLRDIIRTTPKGTNYAIIPSYNSRLYVIKMLETEGYKIDVLLPEKIKNYDLSNYDYLITTNDLMISTVLLKPTKNTVVKYKINKNGDAYYEKKQPLACIYLTTNNIIYDPTKHQTITASSCYIDDKLFEEKGFRLTKAYDFKSQIKDNANFMKIYKNKNKQN